MFNRNVLRNRKRDEKISPSIENPGQESCKGKTSNDECKPVRGMSKFKIPNLLKSSSAYDITTSTGSYIYRSWYSSTVEVDFREFFSNHDRVIVVIDNNGIIKKMNKRMIENIKIINPSTGNFIFDYFNAKDQDCLKNSIATVDTSGTKLRFPSCTGYDPDNSK